MNQDLKKTDLKKQDRNKQAHHQNGNRSGRPFISMRGIEKSYGTKQVLRGIDLEVMEGETLVVLGGSGEGKSVLLRHINGLERPDRGEVTVNGNRLNALSEDELFPIRREVAMVFQLGALFDSLTVFGNVSYPIREHGERDESRIRKRVHEVLQMVELREDVDALLPSELSGGMKKRVALARALALEPKAVLYDEPTTGLDPIVTHKINLMIRGLQNRLGFTSVVVTHDLKSAFMVGDRFALLDQGKIRFTGTADEVRTATDELMREFVATAL
jgi:phospholipid/cholesterol/gamma-HCH transport system ATP-binding protein